MSLSKTLKNPIPQELVQVSDGDGFAVRGLSPTHILGLYFRHAGQLGNLFDSIADRYTNGGSLTPEDTGQLLLALMNDAPLIMAELIALAAGGDPANSEEFVADVNIAKDLAFPVQVDALTKIAGLTFTSDMPVGKFVSLLVGMLQKGVAGQAAPTQNPASD